MEELDELTWETQYLLKWINEDKNLRDAIWTLGNDCYTGRCKYPFEKALRVYIGEMVKVSIWKYPRQIREYPRNLRNSQRLINWKEVAIRFTVI